MTCRFKEILARYQGQKTDNIWNSKGPKPTFDRHDSGIHDPLARVQAAHLSCSCPECEEALAMK
jgi:hypothetical protein